ncbi:PiggyBac transposable element-derived protein 4, partial [Trichinella sp. T6]
LSFIATAVCTLRTCEIPGVNLAPHDRSSAAALSVLKAMQHLSLLSSESVTDDERLYPFKGRCQFRQYMPKKPEKYCIKFSVACCSKSSYAWNMQIYTGKPSSETREKTQWMGVILDMFIMTHVITFYGVFTKRRTKEKEFDFGWNYKTNKQELTRELLQLQGRKLNSSTFAFSEDCTIISYRPKKNKNVTVLSEMHNDNQVCDQKGSKPDIILHYNITKGGVDNLDKMTSTYSCQRMTARWPLVIFYNIIEVSAYNAYTEKHPAWNVGRLHKRRLFLEELGKALVQPEMMRRKTLPRTAAAKSAVEWLRKDAEQPSTSLIRIQVVKKEPDVNSVFQVTTRQAYVVKNAKNTFVKIIHNHIVIYVQKKFKYVNIDPPYYTIYGHSKK